MHPHPEPSIRFIPRQPEHSLDRGRLTERIHRGAQSGLVIVRGPAGSGKTAAIAEWASGQSDYDGVWITLDESVSDRFGFWRQVFESLRDAAIDVPVPVGDLIAGTLPIDDLHQRIVRAFSTIARDVVLVIDDFQRVAGTGVDSDLSMVLQRVRGLSVVIGTRAQSGLETPVSLVTISPTVIGPDELLFTREETEAITQHLMPGAEPDLGEHIHRAVGGWAIATRLVLLEMERHPDAGPLRAVERIVEAQTSGDAGATYLFHEPESDTLRFALRSALAEAVSLELAAELSPDLDHVAVLAWLESEGLGSAHPDEQGTRFRWQPLVRAALKAELARRFPEDLVPVHTIIARWHSRHGEPMLAIHHAALANDWALANEVTRHYFSDLMLYHQPELITVLEGAPRSGLRSNLALVATLAILHYASPTSSADRRRAVADLGISLANSMLRHGSRTERLWISSSLLAAQRVSGNYDAALNTADRIASLASSFDAEERSDVRGILPLLTTQVATTYLYSGQSERAIDYLDLVFDLTNRNAPWSDIHAQSIIALTQALEGDGSATAVAVDAIRDRTTPQGWYGSYPASGFHLAAAWQSLEAFDTAAARERLDELSSHADTIEHWPVLFEIEGLAMLIDGSSDAGDDFSRRVTARQRRTPTSPLMRARVAGVQSDLLISSGHADRARATLRKHSRLLPSIALATARIHLHDNMPASVFEALDRIVWPESRSFRAKAEAALLRAAAHQRLEDTAAALADLTHALDLMDQHDLALPLMMIPRADVIHLARILGQHGEQALLSRLEMVPDVFSDLGPIEALSDRELRVLRELVTTHKTAVIAQRLFVSTNTVKSQLRSLYRKLGVSSRADALAAARKRDLL